MADTLGRATQIVHNLAALTSAVTFVQEHDLAGRSMQVAASIGATADFVNLYEYDDVGRMTQVTQGATGGLPTSAVAEKRVDLTYTAAGQFMSINRYADLAGTQFVAATNYSYDAAGRLASLVHGGTSSVLAGYQWMYDTRHRVTSFTSLIDGTSTYNYDETGQLITADHANQDDESYTYDANGNRTIDGYETGPNNQLLSDGVYNYTYDNEGNRTSKTDANDAVTEYVWDHRNRLVRIIEKDSSGAITKDVEQTYDASNQWIGKQVDDDGDGEFDRSEAFVYDAGQIALRFADDTDEALADSSLANRYLWGPAVDQLLADEQFDASGHSDVLWALTDNLGSIRELARRDATTGETSVVNHKQYDAFGNETIATNAALDTLFGFTGRALDRDTGLQNNLNRWFEAIVGRWLSEDPIGFDASQMNLVVYVGNRPTYATDPSGLSGLGTGDSDFAAAWDSDLVFQITLSHEPGGNPYAFDDPSPNIKQSDWLAQQPRTGYSVGATSEDSPSLGQRIKNDAGLIFVGNYSGAEVTGTGFVGSVLFGLTGADFYKDLLDLGHNVHHWETTGGHVAEFCLNLVALAPVIGAVKNLKYADDLAEGGSEALKRTGGNTTILGNGQTERVVPFAERTGARTLDNGLTEAQWNALSPRKQWKANDGQLRKHINAGDRFRDIGPDGRARSLDLRKAELLRLQDRGIPVEAVSPAEVKRILEK